MAAVEPEIDALIEAAARGDEAARQRLLEWHRERLRRMIAARLDRRLAARVDPSDVVQEAMADASRKLDDYFRDRPMPFFAWLHRLASERVVQTHRRHLECAARAVGRECAECLEQAGHRVDEIAAGGSSPSQRLIAEEQIEWMKNMLERLGAMDREVLCLCYLEGLPFREIAAVLGISANAAKVRHFRALERLRKLSGHDELAELRT